MTQEQFEKIIKWQRETFIHAHPLSKIAHLAKELQELVGAIKSGDMDRDLEYADCFFLLFGAASADGMTYSMICDAIDRKFEINKARQWGKPDEDGVVEHIKSDKP